MNEPPDPIRLKLNRGVNQLKELYGLIEAFVTGDSNGVRNDFESEPNYLLVKAFTNDEPPPIWSLLIGESLYHLRSVLDHLVCELTVANNQIVDSKVEFPIFDDGDRFRNPVTGQLTKPIRDRIGRLDVSKQAIIEGNQPFKGLYGSPHDDPLWFLYELSNFDRHQALHFVSAYSDESSIELEPPEARSRFVRVNTFYGPLKGETTIARFAILRGPQLDVKVTSKVRFDVAFSQPGPLTDRPVLRTLGGIGVRVAELVGNLS